MRVKSSSYSAWLVAIAMLMPAMAIAQQTLGAINGNIADLSGGAIRQATIAIVNNATNLTRTTTSSDNGTFAFQSLPIGVYAVSVSHEGFETAKYPTIRVQESRTTTLTVILKIGQISESVEVAGSPQLNAVDTNNGYILDNAQQASNPTFPVQVQWFRKAPAALQ